MIGYIFFFKQKTAYEMRISDWSSDVCSSDLMDGWVTIHHALSRQDGAWVLGQTKTEGSERTIPAPDRVVESFRVQRERPDWERKKPGDAYLVDEGDSGSALALVCRSARLSPLHRPNVQRAIKEPHPHPTASLAHNHPPRNPQ